MAQGVILFRNDVVFGEMQSLALDVHEDIGEASRSEKLPLTDRGRSTLPDRLRERAALPPIAMPMSARQIRPGFLTSSAIYGFNESGGKLIPDSRKEKARYDSGQGNSSSSSSLPNSGRRTKESSGATSPAIGHLPSVPRSGKWVIRPGTEERRSGHVAAVDSTSLPRIYAPICKDDVHTAVDRLDQTVRAAAEHRRECSTKVAKIGREKAARWQQVQERRKQDHEERLRMAVEEQRRMREEAEMQAKVAADVRWKRAFERLKGRKSHAMEYIESARASPTPLGSKSGDEYDSPSPVVPYEKEDLHVEKVVVKNLSWRVKSVPLDAHIEFLRKIQRLRNRCARAAQTYEARKMRFERLPEEERAMCEEAYLRFGPNPEHRVLDVPSTRECLYELGLRGVDIGEQLTVLRCVVEAHNHALKVAKGFLTVEENAAPGEKSADTASAQSAIDGINLYTFATNVVPAVRKELQLYRQPQVEIEFNAKDVTGEGLISIQSCVEIARTHSQAPCDWDASTVLKVVESTLTEQEVSLLQLHLPPEIEQPKVEKVAVSDFIASVKAQRAQKDKEDRAIARAKERDEARINKQELNFDMARRLIGVFCEKAQLEQCAQERKIQDEFKIDRDTFKALRADVPLLVKQFVEQTSESETGLLSEARMIKIFKDFGLSGVNDHLQHVGETGIDFTDMLKLLEQIRCDLESDAFDELREVFEEFVKPKQRISVKEIRSFLDAESMLTETPGEKEALKKATQDVFAMSTDEDGFLGFKQFKRVMQRAREITNAVQHQKEVKAALENGFKESELDELHSTFDALDEDESGTIDAEEVWASVCSLGFKISRSVFDSVFAQVDEDDSGGLDFIEFLKLLRLIRDREGIFASSRQVKHLEDLLRVEMLHLLTYFKFNLNGEAEAFEDEALLDKVCECFNIDPTAPLLHRLNVKTFQDLCLAAAKEADGEEHSHV